MAERITYPNKTNNPSDPETVKKYFATEANEVKDVVNSHADDIEGLGSGTGQSYPDTATAMAVDPLPADYVPFRVENDPPSPEDGHYRYLASAPGGFEFVRPFVTKTDVIEEGNSGAATSDAVYRNTQKQKHTYIEENRETVNLFDKSTVLTNTWIGASGQLLTDTVDPFKTTNYIAVWSDITYSISGWLPAADRRVSLFEKVGDTTPIEFYEGTNTFTPSQDGYVILMVDNTNVDTSDTLQVQEGPVTPYEPYSPNITEKFRGKFIPDIDKSGIVEEGNVGIVTGGEVFNKTLTKSVYTEENRETVNIFDKSSTRSNHWIVPSGTLQTSTSGDFKTSDWFPVKGGQLYSVSGWFTGVDRRAVLTTAYESTEVIELYSEVDSFTPSQDGYLVVNVDNTNVDTSDTLQVQEGPVTPYEPYSPIVFEKIKEKYIPGHIELSTTSGFNVFDPDKVLEGSLDLSGNFVPDMDGNLTTDFIPVKESQFIFVSGLGQGSAERVYHFYDSDLNRINYNYNRFEGDRHIITLANNAVWFRIFFKQAEESLDINNVVISFRRDTSTKFPGNVTDIREGINYSLGSYQNRNNTANTALNVSFSIESNKQLKNAVVPIFLCKGSRPSGASIHERNIYLGTDVQNDFSDICISQGNRVVRHELHAGNYSLIPFNGLKSKMFQDPVDGYILGSNQYEGVYRSDDSGRTWTQILPDAKLIFMTSSGDILFQFGADIKLATKANNFTDETTVWTSPHATLVMTPNQIDEDDLGNIYFGTYQTEFDAKIYKSTDGGATWGLVYSNTFKQHFHKVWCHNGKVFGCIDGATYQMEGDGVPENRGLATIVSDDQGATWSLVKMPWGSDYGVNNYLDGYYYGSAEANIKYSPSLFRTKDFKNFEEVIKAPINTQAVRTFNSHLIVSTVAYRSFNRAQVFMTTNGREFIPIYDTPNLDSSSMASALRRGSQLNENTHFTDIEGDWVAMVSENSDLGGYRLQIGGDAYQALCYMQVDLEIGQNDFTITNKGNTLINAPKKTEDNSHFYKISFTPEKIIGGNSEHILYNNVVIANGRYDGWMFPYLCKKTEISMNSQYPIRLNDSITGVKSVRFGYKPWMQNTSNTRVSIFNIGDFKIVRDENNIVLLDGGVEYPLTAGSVARVYYDNTPMDYIITLDGTNLTVYINGFQQAQIACSLTELTGDHILIQSREFSQSMDFVSNIYFYDYVINNDKAKEIFDGYPIF